MINGAWNSSDTPTGTTPTNQRGSALSFTYARSGALMARVGAAGQSNQQNNENPNDPIGEYWSAFDHVDLCPTPVLTPMMATTGYSNTYTSVSSGRLYLAIFRWNFYPQYANGSVSVLIDYTSPLQVAVSSSSITGTTAGSAAHPAVIQQTLTSPLPASATLNTASAGTVTVNGWLPVINLTLSSTGTRWVNASGYTPQGPIKPGVPGRRQRSAQPVQRAVAQLCAATLRHAGHWGQRRGHCRRRPEPDAVRPAVRLHLPGHRVQHAAQPLLAAVLPPGQSAAQHPPPPSIVPLSVAHIPS